MDSDEEDYVFVGTPIEREEEITNRRKKAAAEASGNLRSLPPWKQEVRDEEGRRRFHGAFTGGFSAGYFNTVGAKEGWAPQSFTSSRKNRAEVKQQNILNFLDEDEKTELEGQYLGTSSQFDTFGFTAAEYARKQADKEQKQRPSAIPGPVPDELVLPASESIDACREARKAFLAFASEDTKAPNPADFEPVEGEPESFIEQPADDDAQSSQSLPPPPSLRMRSKIDSLLFMPNSVKGAKPEEDVIANSDLPVAQTDAQKTTEDVAGKEIEIAVENVERPIDLYKAIFSDDDVEESNSNKVGDSENIEVATTTLNRLIAGDFLESLGKELGLEVPPDTLYSTNKASNPAQIETPNGDAENAKSIHVEGITFSAPNAVSGTSLNPGQKIAQKGEPSKYESIPGSSLRYSSKYIDGLSENISGKVKSPSRHRRNRSSSSSSEDERSRKHSRRHRYRSSDSYSDSSGDHRDRHRSRSKGRRKKSSQENSSSRKHSKHRKHRKRNSPSRSNHGSEREHSEARKEKRKWRD